MCVGSREAMNQPLQATPCSAQLLGHYEPKKYTEAWSVPSIRSPMAPQLIR